jgi:putative Mg2+ transporter-C (MgtC) family protein
MEIEIISQLILAIVLGALIGAEREQKKKGAGLRTYSLVSFGTCLFTIMAFNFFSLFYGGTGVTFDPSRVIQAIATGIGFIGAGVIFRQPSGVVGLTTAAGLWVAAAIGVAVGGKFYFTAVLGTVLVLLILIGLGALEEKFFKKGPEKSAPPF